MDTDLYELTLKSLKQLIVPSKYEVEIIKINKKDNIVAYNQAMNSSDAKYKIYVRNGVEIKNKNFIADMIKIFKTNWNIGIIGMSGVKVIPTDADIFASATRIGKLNDVDGREVIFSDSPDMYELAAAIDEYLMMTQYDISWREDLFCGDGLYNVAQCVEFKRNYYSVAIAGQKTPWVLYREKNIVIAQDEKEKFMYEYSKDIYPLVSILIPTYNRPQYFEIALKSAVTQTYRNVEIIIGDDSTDDKTEKIVQRYQEKYNNIFYKRNNRKCATAAERSYANYSEVLHRSHGEYVNYLHDDDIFAPSKIEKMINYYLQYSNVSLVTSYRNLINADGNKSDFNGYPRWKVEKDTLVNSKTALKNLIMNVNFIGEPTTCLVRRSTINNNFGTFAGKSFDCLNDLAQWMQSLQQGDLVYIKEPLSSLRVHDGQKTNDLFIELVFKNDYFYMYTLSYQKKLISKDEFYSIMQTWLKRAEYEPQLLDWLRTQKQARFYDEDIIDEFLLLKNQAQNIVDKLIQDTN
ncbi:glycosyltransferase involved in cell wall biosynthesis [Pectinatus brassicae]|uniref:Glycosyltransferase involved in cell wall biosynthesis n=2 Tax=Pectinatus brassicae TaxID=862415 RepID=A0A840UII1_9FIRM|nr:glycosyltransferase involved in cell wall biosynthesis [Pectinatus brassicae]